MHVLENLDADRLTTYILNVKIVYAETRPDKKTSHHLKHLPSKITIPVISRLVMPDGFRL